MPKSLGYTLHLSAVIIQSATGPTVYRLFAISLKLGEKYMFALQFTPIFGGL